MQLVDGIAWTPEDRDLVYASRRRPNPAYLKWAVGHISSKENYQVPLDEEVWLREVREYCTQEANGAVAHLRAGLANNPPHWKPAVEAAIERAHAPQASGPLDVDTEAVLAALEVCPMFAIVPYWLAREGTVFALRALIRSHQIIGDVKINGYHGANFVVERAWCKHDSYDTAWHLLRGSLAEAIEPIYDEALQVGDRLRLEVGSMLQGLLAFAFPDELAWAEQAGDGMIEIAGSVKKGYTPALARYVSVAPPKIATEIVGSTTNTAITRADLLTMLAFGGTSPGAKVLDTAIRAASSHDTRKEYARVLMVVHTKEASELLRKLGSFAPNALMPIKRMHDKAVAKLAKPAPKAKAKPKANKK